MTLPCPWGCCLGTVVRAEDVSTLEIRGEAYSADRVDAGDRLETLRGEYDQDEFTHHAEGAIYEHSLERPKGYLEGRDKTPSID